MGIYIKPEKKLNVYISFTVGVTLAITSFILGMNPIMCFFVFLACLTFTSTMSQAKTDFLLGNVKPKQPEETQETDE